MSLNNQETRNQFFRTSSILKGSGALPSGGGLSSGRGILGYRRTLTRSDAIVNEDGGGNGSITETDDDDMYGYDSTEVDSGVSDDNDDNQSNIFQREEEISEEEAIRIFTSDRYKEADIIRVINVLKTDKITEGAIKDSIRANNKKGSTTKRIVRNRKTADNSISQGDELKEGDTPKTQQRNLRSGKSNKTRNENS
jgi:hypothetical protein